MSEFPSEISDEHVPDTSALSSLAARRKKAAESLHVDLVVPRIVDPEVVVRYGPVRRQRAQAAQNQVQARKEKNADVVANAIILAEVCLGIFEKIDGKLVSIDPEDRDGETPVTFRSPRLAEMLGVQATKGSDLVQELYVTEGDLLSAASEVSEWSGYTGEQQQADIDEGN